MILGVVFLGAGATLAALRKRAARSNECDDFPECDQPSGLAKSCCSSTASLTGVLEAAEASEAAASEEETTCKFCDANASCRFCFAGPERGELIAPCACVGSQVRTRARDFSRLRRRSHDRTIRVSDENASGLRLLHRLYQRHRSTSF